MSICPKNKSSKSRRDKRRANWKMSAPTLVKCSKCGALMMPHRVCKACGSYNKREIVSVENYHGNPSYFSFEIDGFLFLLFAGERKNGWLTGRNRV